MKEFAKEGAIVAIFDINVAAGRKLAKEISDEGKSVHFYEGWLVECSSRVFSELSYRAVDVSKKDVAAKAAAEFAKLNGGKIHHLFNNGANKHPFIFLRCFRSCVFRFERPER